MIVAVIIMAIMIIVLLVHPVRAQPAIIHTRYGTRKGTADTRTQLQQRKGVWRKRKQTANAEKGKGA